MRRGFGALQYGGFTPQVQELASGVGVLLLLWMLPGGLAQVFYSARDSVLRAIAERRSLVVPSLVADVARPTPTRLRVANDTTLGLADAPALTESEGEEAMSRVTEPLNTPSRLEAHHGRGAGVSRWS